MNAVELKAKVIKAEEVVESERRYEMLISVQIGDKTFDTLWIAPKDVLGGAFAPIYSKGLPSQFEELGIKIDLSEPKEAFTKVVKPMFLQLQKNIEQNLRKAHRTHLVHLVASLLQEVHSWAKDKITIIPSEDEYVKRGGGYLKVVLQQKEGPVTLEVSANREGGAWSVSSQYHTLPGKPQMADKAAKKMNEAMLTMVAQIRNAQETNKRRLEYEQSLLKAFLPRVDEVPGIEVHPEVHDKGKICIGKFRLNQFDPNKKMKTFDKGIRVTSRTAENRYEVQVVGSISKEQIEKILKIVLA